MAEFVAIVGAIAACSQLAKYGTGLARSILDCPSEMRAIPTIVKDIDEHLTWHLSIVRSFDNDASNGTAAPSVEPIISRSIRAASSIQQLLAPLLVDGKQKRANKLRRVLSYQRRIRKIDRCRADLERCERQLTLHFSLNEASIVTFTNWSNIPELYFIDPARIHHVLGGAIWSTAAVRVHWKTISRVFGFPGTNRTWQQSMPRWPWWHRVSSKSEVAKECAYNIHELHPNISVFWIHVSDRFTLEMSLEQLFREIKPFDATEIQEMTIIKLIDKLDMTWCGQWILIVDDIRIETIGSPDLEKLTSLSIKNGSILFTTRTTYTAVHLAESRLIFPLDPLAVCEAEQLLALQLSDNTPSYDDIFPLIDYLEYHPLAIVLAATSMKADKISGAQYLQRLRGQEERFSALLIQSSHGQSRHPGTFDILSNCLLSVVSLEDLRIQDEEAAHLLAVLACLSEEHIPLALCDTGQSVAQLFRVLAVLRASSLISLDDINSVVKVPRLVRLGVRYSLWQHQTSSTYALHALQLASQHFPEPQKQYAMLAGCKLLLPHALGLLKEYAAALKTGCYSSLHSMAATRGLHVPSNNLQEPSYGYRTFYNDNTYPKPIDPLEYIGPLALRVSHFLCILGQYSNAMEIANQASRWLSGACPAETIACETSITELIHYLGRPTLYANQIEEIFCCQTVLLKSHRPLTIRVLRAKGMALQAQGHYAQAEGYHRRAIAICESTYDAKDTKLLDEKHGLALSLLGQHRSEEALNSLCRIYSTMEATLTLSNPNTLSVLANIGCALQHLARWADAYQVMTRALDGRVRVLGEDHPQTIQTRANLAQIYVESGDYAYAESITRETLRLHVMKLGEDHHLSLHILNNLGYLLFWQERYAESAETLQRVARTREAVLGPEHCDTLDSLFYASEAYWKIGEFDQALELGGKVLQARMSLDEDDAPRKEIEEHMAGLERDRRVSLLM
ncbi:TPR-like protein [Bimuria novae-zelandiae CBS 107.79]|uniref:TPR-like protein n=1 Tax=Bimuria novae-zelandiae CBS 107.79 TaxID=1447943 RepID=A0A6A5V620_9PLEO|nr:TPR-like protein [Bimuria novae-zelandiae CBS 107.79]